jgi:HD domain-containing protein
VSNPATLLGPVKIGGGTPIIEHLSQNATITVPVIAPNNCATLPPITFSGASDGDTIALGVKNALTSGGNLTYFAWVNATNTIGIKVCNPHGTTNSALTGMIRVDIWKH